MKRHERLNKIKSFFLKHKKGFTLMEAIVSVAIFSMMAFMFSTFMFTSTRMVNMSIMYDRDRELLIQAIEGDSTTPGEIGSGEVNISNGVTVRVYNEDEGREEYLTIELNNSKIKAQLKGDFLVYTSPNGIKYTIYLGRTNAEGEDDFTVVGP